MFLVRFAVRAAAMSFLPALLGAQSPATGVVAGRVTARADSGAPTPIAGATVVAPGLRDARAITDDDGRFRLEGVPSGPLTVRVRRLGYRGVARTLRVPAGDTARVDIALEAEARLLDPVRTDARSAEAEAFTAAPDVGTLRLGAAAMAGVPAVGEPDVVRVVQLLPGVAARNDFNTGLNVRGGEADQNLVLLDGHPIYNPFHLGGLFSTFMDATVGEVALLTSAFPARYGGRLSSVLDVQSADDARRDAHASADVSALGATGRLAGSFGRGDGTWSVAARRTYADAVTALVTDDIFPYHFRDFHGRATYGLPGGARLALTAYAGRDVLDANLSEFESESGQSRAGEGAWAFDWGNRVLGATVSKEVAPGARVPLSGWRLGEGATVEQRVSTSGFSTRLELGDGASAQRSAIRDVRLGGSLLIRGARHDPSVGYELATHRVRYASGSPQTGTTNFDLVQRPASAAVWLDDLWRPAARWRVQGGLRAEALSGRNWAGLSPRVSVKYLATPELAFTAGTGRATQWLHSLAGDGPLRYFDIWLASDERIPVATAWHWVAGAERRAGDAGSVRLEGYVKRYGRVLEANASEDPRRRGDELLAARGTSYGVDLLARRQPARGIGGWIAYSYGVSSRSRAGVRWAPGHDRRHDLDVVATARVARYRLGARVGYATGTPYTPIVGEIARRVYDPSLDRWGTGEPPIYLESLGGVRNGARFPATHRLDLEASREFRVRGAMLAPYVSVANAYNARNVFVYLYQYSTDNPTRRAISQFPVLPSAGVRVDF